MHLVKFYSGIEKFLICNDDHLPAWNLSKRTIKPIILAKNLKDHKRVHDLILKRCKTLIENNLIIITRWLLFMFYLKQPPIPHPPGADRNSSYGHLKKRKKNSALSIKAIMSYSLLLFQFLNIQHSLRITIWHIYQNHFTFIYQWF